MTCINTIIKHKKINAYVVSARYELLEKDFIRWIKIIDPGKVFSNYFYNNKNDQPQLFKEMMIKKLQLDLFVEDNWDIVKHINQRSKIKDKKVKVLWISNILDRNINYKYKFPSLKKVVKYLKLATNH